MSTEAQNTPSDIDLVQTALTEFNAVEAGLQDLRQRFGGVVYDVTTDKGMAEAKEARKALREPRLKIEAIRVAAKAPILALGRKLDADAKRVTAEIAKLEDPIQAQIDNEEARKERERQAAIAVEAARVTAIQERITELRDVVHIRFTRAANILDHIGDIERIQIDASFAEFQETAAAAKAASLTRLREMHQAAEAQEAEAARLKAEREELERLRAEQEAREKAERERREAEEAAAAEVRRQEQAKIGAERAELDRQRREQEKAAVDAQAVIDAENQRLADERAAFERQQEELRRAQEAKPAVDPDPPPQTRVVNTPAPTYSMPRQRPSDAEIIEAVAQRFDVTQATAAGWLASMRLAA